jgi:8-hydroxy-5-deazaflavin:NADPH oxidoreductase
MKVAVIGGSGAMGKALARHLSREHEVIIGSRDPSRAAAAASGIEGASGADYKGASRAADTVIFAIPYEAIGLVADLAGEVSSKLAISVINPMKTEEGLLRYALKDGSAAEELARILPHSRVATAFNNVPSGFLKDEVVPPVDILVAADSKETYQEAAKLVASIREMRPLYVGPLAEARIVEELTPLVLNVANLNGTKALTTRFVTRRG